MSTRLFLIVDFSFGVLCWYNRKDDKVMFDHRVFESQAKNKDFFPDKIVFRGTNRFQISTVSNYYRGETFFLIIVL